jgi:hypothetical protein
MLSTRRPLFLLLLLVLPASLHAQTDCEKGDGLLNYDLPQDLTADGIIQKFAVAESAAKAARNQYSFVQDVLVQTLSGRSVDGEFHEVTTIAYDPRGKRIENVTYAEQSTLRRIALTADDMEDIHTFMPFTLTTAELPQYNLRYTGQQRVDDLDTFVFHLEPRKLEHDRRYFEGRIWIDNRDFQIVKVCGKSVPNKIQVKKHERQDLRPTFVTYRQPVDGHWFPAYTRVDDTLRFNTGDVRMVEVVKYTAYKRTGAAPSAP